MMYSIHFVILFLLLHSVHGSVKISHLKQDLQQLLKPVASDYDNRYVWFTRNIRSKRRNHEKFHSNNFNAFLPRTQSSVKLEELITTK